MKKFLYLILLSSLFILQSCFLYGKKNALSLTTVVKQKTNLSSQLTSVNVSQNIVTINGSGFSNITSAKLVGTNLDADLKINSKSDSQIIATASNAISLLIGETFNLIIGTAEAQTTYTVTFTLQNGAIELRHLSSLEATTAGQILKFNGTSWKPDFLPASQNYLGTWSALTYAPDITSIGTFNAGDYYIVDSAGAYTSGVLTINPTTLAVGDWLMFNGSKWDKVLTGDISGPGTTNYIPYYKSSNVLANSPMSVSGSTLDIKGTLRLSGATSGFVGLAPAANAGGTIYTLPVADGTNGQVLTTNASGVLSWTSASISAGTISNVTSANTDIVVASGTTSPVLTLNSGTNGDQIVKLTAAAKLPAVDGSLLTNLKSSNLVGPVAVENGGTGVVTLEASKIALGIKIAGPIDGNVPILGATIVADRLCTSDVLGGKISCIDNFPADKLRDSVFGTSGTGNLLFGSSPTIFNPVITNIAPGNDFKLTQNLVEPFTSVNTGAVANTLYLKGGNVGIGTITPIVPLHIVAPGTIGLDTIMKLGVLDSNDYLLLQNNTSTANNFDPTFFGVTTRSGGIPLSFVGAVTGGNDTGTSPLINFQARVGSESTASYVVNRDLFNFSNVTTSVMRITSNGNVGIGKINPSYKLNVFGLGDDLTSGSIVAQNSSNTSNAGSLLSVFSADSSGGIGAYPSGNTNISSLAKRVFLTANSSASGLVLYAPNASQDIRFFAGSATEKMRINNLGNVGIGTTSPQRPLHIAGAKAVTLSMIALENTDPTDANGTVISFRGPTTGVGATTFVEYSAIQARVDIHDHATRTSSLGFYTSSSGTATERLRIDNSGNVGIGTTGSIYKLDVQGGDINTNGNVRAVSVVQTSDKRWKKNISPQKITLKN